MPNPFPVAVLIVMTLAIVPRLINSGQAQITDCALAVGWTELTPPEPAGLDQPGAPLTRGIATSWIAPNILYAGASRGLYETANCGATWELLPFQPIRQGAAVGHVAVARDGTLYASGLFDALRISQDGGQTWTFSSRMTGHVSPSPAEPGLVYASLLNSYIQGPRGLGRSDDYGQTWEIRNQDGGGEVDAFDPNTVYRSGISCARADEPPQAARTSSVVLTRDRASLHLQLSQNSQAQCP